MNGNNLRHEGKTISLYVLLYVLIIYVNINFFSYIYTLNNFQIKYITYLLSIFATYLLPFLYGYSYKIINKNEMSDSLRNKLSYWTLICTACSSIIVFINLIPEIIYTDPASFIFILISLSVGFIILWLITYLLLGANRFKILTLLILFWLLMPYIDKILESSLKNSKQSIEQSIERIKLTKLKSKE